MAFDMKEGIVKEILDKSMEEWRDEVDRLVRLDRSNLYEAAAVHTEHYWKFAAMSAVASGKRDDLARELDEIRGDLDLDIRKDPAKHLEFMVEKDRVKDLKEHAVKAFINADDEVSELTEESIQWRALAKLFNKATDAFDTRRALLGKLIDWAEREMSQGRDIRRGEANEAHKEAARKTGRKGKKVREE